MKIMLVLNTSAFWIACGFIGLYWKEDKKAGVIGWTSLAVFYLILILMELLPNT